MSIRIFNPETGLWSIWWADNNACTLFPPVHGRFVDGVGEFRGTDIQDGTPVDVRYPLDEHHPHLREMEVGHVYRWWRDLGIQLGNALHP